MIFPTKYEVQIGLEIHARINTSFKLFCKCQVTNDAVPNTKICPVCMKEAEAKYILNHDAVKAAVMLGAATNSVIHKSSVFEKKLYQGTSGAPRGYQITQNKKPICSGGYILINTSEEGIKQIGISKIIIEEDSGKPINDSQGNIVSFDFNRTGISLLEIISEPDLHSAEEAIAFIRKLRQILQYLTISEAKMEAGTMRFDVNVSLREQGNIISGTKTELKGLNSYKLAKEAVDAEISRQINLLSSGQNVEPASLRYDLKLKKIIHIRKREPVSTGTYSPAPEIKHLNLNPNEIQKIKMKIPELPDSKHQRLMMDYYLTKEEAEIISADINFCNFFESAVYNLITKTPQKINEVKNWMLSRVVEVLNKQKTDVTKIHLTPFQLAKIIELESVGKINHITAIMLFTQIINGDIIDDPEAIILDNNLFQIQDESIIITLIEKVLSANMKELKRFYKGDTQLLSFFMGQLMYESNNQFEPKLLKKMLLKYLSKGKK